MFLFLTTTTTTESNGGYQAKRFLNDDEDDSKQTSQLSLMCFSAKKCEIAFNTAHSYDVALRDVFPFNVLDIRTTTCCTFFAQNRQADRKEEKK